MVGENHQMPVFVRAPYPGDRHRASSLQSIVLLIKLTREFAGKLNGCLFSTDAVNVFVSVIINKTMFNPKNEEPFSAHVFHHARFAFGRTRDLHEEEDG